MTNNSLHTVWVKNAESFVSSQLKLRTVGFTAKSKFAAPLTSAKLIQLQDKLAPKLPVAVRDFLSEGSAACRFRYEWDLTDVPPGRLGPTGIGEDRIYGGTDLCVAASMAEWADDCKAWATETWIAEDAEQQEIWLKSLPIASISNGDYLGARTGEEPDPAVVYLSHDGTSKAIAPSFTAFLTSWARLCYLGPEIWLLENFIDPETGFLNADTDEAQALRALFRIGE